ncbi:MAG TPA: hypothetical protein VE870_05980 [Bacteroidales bacterium]|nr:hypothetical protein [Bacteroidales bacterium]
MKDLKLLYLLFVLPMVLLACQKSDDYQLSQSVFIEDPYYPGLPGYSEWGYNTFGAYIDRKPFTSNNYEIPAKIIVNGDVMHIIMKGDMLGQNVKLTFSIKGYSPPDYIDLKTLDNTVINLKDTGNTVTLEIGDSEKILNLIEGELTFKRVQNLYVDEELDRAIVSGTFNFKTFLDNEPVAISHGRFDFGIGYENFYNY